MAGRKEPNDPHKQFFYPDRFGQEPQLLDNFTSLQLSYRFKSPIQDVLAGLVRQSYWEDNNQITSVHGVQQLDDDRIVFYRKKEHFMKGQSCEWEQVVINR